MNRLLRGAFRWLSLLGIDPRKLLRTLRGLPAYFRDRRTLRRQQRTAARVFSWGKYVPCLDDRAGESGLARGHYFHQDLLVARRIFLRQPELHADVGSRIDGFVAHAASFRMIHVFDLRHQSTAVPNVQFVQANFMEPLGPQFVDYCDSLSCLHALEHFGLGRYGDPVNYDGWLLGLDNLHRMLKPGGTLYLSVPIGPQRIEFNAHRVFAVETLVECLRGKFAIQRFSYVDDRGDLHEDAPLTADESHANFGCKYGCGIFELMKLGEA